MAKVSDLPVLDRPREKALYYGIEELADHELLALLIGSGSQNNSAIDIAYFMLRDNSGLANLVQKPLSDLLNYKGIGKGKAVKLIAAFELAKRYQQKSHNVDEIISDSKMIYHRMKKVFCTYPYIYQEYLYLIILDKKKRIIHEMNLYKGNESSVSASTMQIIQQVIIHSGKYFYIIHNHPSGILRPSGEDVFFTFNIINECQKLSIEMLDHLIISQNGYYSLLSHESYEE